MFRRWLQSCLIKINFVYGFFQSFKYIITIKPNLCIAFGSYASFTPLTIALILKFFKITKIYLHEQNSVLGKVNKLFISFADNVFVSFKKTEGIESKYNYKVIHSGLPIRVNNIKEFVKNYKVSRKNKKLRVLFFGGSQGAYNLSKNFV